MRTPVSWVSMLKATACNDLPEYSPSSPSVHTFGYLNKTDSLPAHAEGYWGVDEVTYPIVQAECQDFEPDAYCVAKPSHSNVLRTIKKYDHEEIDVALDTPFLSRLETEVIPIVRDWYAEIHQQCRVLPFHECKYVYSSSPGPVFKWGLLKTKQDVVVEMRDYLEWYCEGGYRTACPPLWKQNGKIELLKSKKVLSHDIRGFMVPPVDELFLQSMYQQDANEHQDLLWARGVEHYGAPGFNMRAGGLVHLFAELKAVVDSGGILWKGDLKKYDGTQQRWLTEMNIEDRYLLWDRKCVSEEEWRFAMGHIYDEMGTKRVMLPNGQILVISTGMPSGTTTTSNDGSRNHENAVAWHTLRVTDKSVSLMKQHVVGKLYCDDHIFSADEAYEAVSDRKERAKSYAQFGMELHDDPEEDLVTRDIEEMSFLGMKLNPKGQPIPSRRQKFLHALARPDGPKTLNVGLSRAVSLMSVGCFDDQLYRVARMCADTFVRKGATWVVSDSSDLPAYIPSRKELQDAWYGMESMSGIGQLISRGWSLYHN